MGIQLGYLPAQSNAGPRGQYATAEDLNDTFGDESPFSDFFNRTFRGARNGGQPRPCSGLDIELPIDIGLVDAYHGTARVLQVGNRRIEAKIPPGVRTGSRVRLAGQGEPGRNGGPPGDLYLIVNVLPHSKFEREGDDLYTDAPVDIYTTAIGGEFEVQTMDRPVMLKIPPQTQSVHNFRLRGKGMPKLDNSKSRGDLFARAKLVLPEPLSERELNTFRELKAVRVNR